MILASELTKNQALSKMTKSLRATRAIHRALNSTFFRPLSETAAPTRLRTTTTNNQHQHRHRTFSSASASATSSSSTSSTSSTSTGSPASPAAMDAGYVFNTWTGESDGGGSGGLFTVVRSVKSVDEGSSDGRPRVLFVFEDEVYYTDKR